MANKTVKWLRNSQCFELGIGIQFGYNFAFGCISIAVFEKYLPAKYEVFILSPESFFSPETSATS